ncbi:MAG: aminotransferase class I/II-fold pyridoxal phosphate-dependent enzyme, partial [Akkermansiaceae bacterium]|nr:aminotransferase class I/II-fold pyridoxal phosphate-dependent enzyme [Akkermansiaceae bacterium]
SGALLLLDEAHALGVLGRRGAGLAEEAGVAADIDLRMTTMGKAAGAAGGIVGGSKEAISLLWNRARSFIYSTAPPPAQVAAAT